MNNLAKIVLFLVVGVELFYVAVSSKEEGLVTTSPSTFSARVVYKIPTMEELSRLFPAKVHPLLVYGTFNPIKVCKNVSRETREVGFEYVYLGREASFEDVIFEIEVRGLRPALIEELIAFAARYPEEYRQRPTIALGSIAEMSDYHWYWFILQDEVGKKLSVSNIEDNFRPSARFLTVRK
ncbi:MAG: hypothetical protein Q7N87_01545 [Candidatus Uhrbacteria bacterium]|nr:hypothetical protein [Candidatus Uhrbacteria bacterium]